MADFMRNAEALRSCIRRETEAARSATCAASRQVHNGLELIYRGMLEVLTMSRDAAPNAARRPTLTLVAV